MIVITVTRLGASVRVNVSDRTGPTVPLPRAEDDMVESGRGLLLVETLADDWGYERKGPRTSTWFSCSPLSAYGSSVTMTARVSGSRASKTCGTSPGYLR